MDGNSTDGAYGTADSRESSMTPHSSGHSATRSVTPPVKRTSRGSARDLSPALPGSPAGPMIWQSTSHVQHEWRIVRPTTLAQVPDGGTFRSPIEVKPAEFEGTPASFDAGYARAALDERPQPRPLPVPAMPQFIAAIDSASAGPAEAEPGYAPQRPSAPGVSRAPPPYGTPTPTAILYEPKDVDATVRESPQRSAPSFYTGTSNPSSATAVEQSEVSFGGPVIRPVYPEIASVQSFHATETIGQVQQPLPGSAPAMPGMIPIDTRQTSLVSLVRAGGQGQLPVSAGTVPSVPVSLTGSMPYGFPIPTPVPEVGMRPDAALPNSGKLSAEYFIGTSANTHGSLTSPPIPGRSTGPETNPVHDSSGWNQQFSKILPAPHIFFARDHARLR